MTTPMAIAMACCACGARPNGANQSAMGTIAESVRPQKTTDTGGRSSICCSRSNARSGIASVVKQSSSPQDIVENRLAAGVDGNQRQTDLVIGQKAEAFHHVLERNRIRIEKNRLRDGEQLVMDAARLVPVTVCRRPA